MSAYPEFARLLNQYLAKHARPVAWLARQLRRTASTVNRWANGETHPGDAATVKAILDVFGVQDPSERHDFFMAAGYVDLDQTDSLSHLLKPSEDIGPSPTIPPHDFVAYDDSWVGREELVQGLSGQIQNSRRLLVIVGMAGIGKTALAERLSVTLTTWLQLDLYPITRLNFDYQMHGTDFVSVAMKWLGDWGEAAGSEEQRVPALLLRRILQSLGKQRRLIIIDALEKVMTSGQDGQSSLGDEWWAQFFHAVLAAETLQGRVIVTTQDLPVQLVKYGAEYPNRWLRIALGGLGERERIALFQAHGLQIQPTSEVAQLLSRIGQVYAGHPLALRAIAGEIRQDHGGNVLAYWQEFGRQIETVERDLATARQNGNVHAGNDDWRLDRFSVELQRQVHHRLNDTFERLRHHALDAYQLICAVSVYRGPAKARYWLAQLDALEKTAGQQQTALQALRDRALVEEIYDNKGTRLFALHNLIRSIALEHRRQFAATDVEALP